MKISQRLLKMMVTKSNHKKGPKKKSCVLHVCCIKEHEVFCRHKKKRLENQSVCCIEEHKVFCRACVPRAGGRLRLFGVRAQLIRQHPEPAQNLLHRRGNVGGPRRFLHFRQEGIQKRLLYVIQHGIHRLPAHRIHPPARRRSHGIDQQLLQRVLEPGEGPQDRPE